MVILSEADVSRFNEKYEIVTESGCWIWTACRAGTGYGTFRVNKKSYSAHKISYFINKGEVRDGLHVLHRCDVRECVNPNHLFLGTNKDNVLDAVLKGRKKHSKDYKRPSGLKYKPMSEDGKKAHWWYSEETRKQVVSLLQAKLPQRQIAKMVGMSQGNVSRIKKEYL